MSAKGEEDQPPCKKVKTEINEETEGENQEIVKKEEKAVKDLSTRINLLSKLKEEDVGITEYISQHNPISGIIKQRYSDFIVNEVSTSGEVVHLTSTELPPEETETPEAEPNDPVDSAIPEEFLIQLKKVASGSEPGFTASTPAGDDKMWRLRLHRAVKAAFPKVETKTEDQDGVKVIIAMLRGKGKDNRRSNSLQWPTSKTTYPFCRFVLFKENKSTMEVMHLLSKFLKVRESVFSYAGNKDKRAKTTQEVTAFKIHPQRLSNLNKFLRQIVLGNFSYAEKRLSLGSLDGNRFTIVLRKVIGDEKDIEVGLTSLKTKGFINYFGMQRFGSAQTCTHHVGRALLKEEWEKAAELIICGTSEEGVEYHKKWQETKDARATLALCGGPNYIERSVLQCLAKNSTDYLGAIHSLARNQRSLYLHSYQSVIWNTIVSRRIKTFGLEPKVGDLVLPPEAAKLMETSTEEQGSKSAEGQEDKTSEGEDNKMTVKMEEEDSKTAEEQDTSNTEQESTNKNEASGKNKRKFDQVSKPIVHPIVLDAATVSQYSIYDIVLPLPGFDVVYPDNEVYSWYKEMLESDGLDIENMRRKQKDLSLPGGYRPVVIRPKDVEWKVMRYNDVTASLSLSDADLMNGVEEPESIPDGEMKAVQLSFTLGLSAYATMALREVLKIDTSPSHQASMNTS